ncbi:hypothetical protein HK096_010663, partial [Nowakowskiella sp. JEL0078]
MQLGPGSPFADVHKIIQDFTTLAHQNRILWKKDVLFCPKVIGTFDRLQNLLYNCTPQLGSLKEESWITAKRALNKPNFIITPDELLPDNIHVFWIEGNLESINNLKKKLCDQDPIKSHTML